MAVTLDVAGLVAALRLADSPEELAEATRILAYAADAVVQHAPNAPDTAHNEAAVRLSAYLYDMPTAARGDSYANALRNSGAQRMLLPYRVHRAGYAEAVESAQEAVGSVGNPVTGLAVVSGQLVVTFADGTTDALDLPAGMGGGDGVDQIARDAAAAATASLTAHAGLPNVHHTPTPPGGGTGDDAFEWATEGNTDLIPKGKVTTAANGQYLLVSDTGVIIGRTGTPDGGGDGGTSEIATLVTTLDQQTIAIQTPVILNDLTMPSANFAATEKWLFVYAGAAFMNQTASSTAVTCQLRLFAGATEIATTFVSDEDSYTASDFTHQTVMVAVRTFTAAEAVTVNVDFGGGNGNVHDAKLTAVKLAAAGDTEIDARIAEWAAAGNIDARIADWAETGNTDAIPADKLTNAPAGGGGGGQWYNVGQLVGGAYEANTARTFTLSFPIAGFSDYASLRAAVVDGSIKQVAVRIGQNDIGDGDDDHGVTVFPNISGFRYVLAGGFRVFPGHALNVDPVAFLVDFNAAGLRVTTDAALTASPAVSVTVGVWV